MSVKKKTMTVKELRTAQKLSQSAFAASIGVSAQSVSAYESGRRDISAKALKKITEVYGVQIKLVKEEAKAAPQPEEACCCVGSTCCAPRVEVVLQSPMGGSITVDEILARCGEADHVYVRVDENKAYWVNGEDSGAIDLW